MLCEKCNKNIATTHIHTVVNGVSKEMHLCSQCAANEGFHSAIDGGFNSMLATMFGETSALNSKGKEKRCECCGSTFNDIALTGKAGCPDCYKTFYNEFLPYVKRVHGSVKHIGKTPETSGKNENKENSSIVALKTELSRLIAEEKFEQAAVIRDRIKELEAKQ